MIKLVASDLDGTLLQNGAQKLNPEIFDLILKLKEQGIHFIAASGRQYASLRNLFEPVQDRISYISENGSLCIHNGEILKRGIIDRELGLRIFNEIRKYENCDIMLSCEDRCYIESKKPDFYHLIHDELGYDVELVSDLSEIDKPFLKIAVHDSKTLDNSYTHLRELFASEIQLVTSGNVWMDFVAPNANKGTALQMFLDYFSVKPEECMAFGDQHNDLEMLQLAGSGYAMSNAAPGVAAHSKYVTDSVEEVLKDLIF